MALHKYRECIHDSTEVLRLSSGNIKALKRKAFSHMMLFEFDNAADCYKKAMTLAPTDK